MLEKRIDLNRAVTEEEFLNLILEKFPDWKIDYGGTLKKYPRSFHYHITSTKANHTGVLEISVIFEASNTIVMLKLASNRIGNWSQPAFNDLEKYLLTR